VIEMLPAASVKRFFRMGKRQRRYFCPRCLAEANRDGDFDFKLAVLQPKEPASTALYCPICGYEHPVVRGDCAAKGCLGNVLSERDGTCLTCGRWQQTRDQPTVMHRVTQAAFFVEIMTHCEGARRGIAAPRVE